MFLSHVFAIYEQYWFSYEGKAYTVSIKSDL
jgi:hypothetical protein